MKALNWLVGLIGVWFIVAPFALKFSGDKGALWASIIVGAIQVIVAVWAAVSDQVKGWGVWQSWIAALAGVWFVIQPYALSQASSVKWSSVILGIITIILCLWAMQASADKK